MSDPVVEVEAMASRTSACQVLLYFCGIGPNPGKAGASVANAAEDLGLDIDACVDVIARLVAEGMLSNPDRALAPSSDSPVPTATGRAVGQQIAEISETGVARRKAVRNGFVRWLGTGIAPRGATDFLDSGSRTIGISPIQWPELDEAIGYLREQGLLDGYGVMGPEFLMPRLTAQGLDCAEQFEGDVTAYIGAVRYGRGSTVHISQVTGSNIAIAGHDVTQHVEESSEAVRAIVEQLRAVESVLGQLALEAADEDKIRIALRDLSKPDDQRGWQDRVKAAATEVGSILKGATTSGLGQAFAQALLDN